MKFDSETPKLIRQYDIHSPLQKLDFCRRFRLTIISIVTNDIVLEFSSAQFIHPRSTQISILFLYLIELKITKADKHLFFDYNDVRASQVLKWTAGCSFECETTKMNLAKNINGILSKNVLA